MTQERPFQAISGWLPLVLIIAGLFISISLTMSAPVMAFLLLGLTLFCCCGFHAVAPNEARVLLLFGNYQGTIKQGGFLWSNPFFTRRKISLRMRNFETGQQTTTEVKSNERNFLQSAFVSEASHGSYASRLARRPTKVNDRDGNPIEISAIVVWRVVSPAEAVFDVDDYEGYVHLQSEAALRILASRYPYDSADDELSLRRSTAEVSDQLKREIDERFHRAGVEVLEARINQLSYAPKVAAAMLQRQQAQAVVAARTKIVEGAVGMVQMALEHLQERKLVELSTDQQAALVSNLLVVLCGDRHVQPVLSTSSRS
ncbi:SPFH domain-containing protein [bacterium]|nr:SPFH domain-containing protein [bacterium]